MKMFKQKQSSILNLLSQQNSGCTIVDGNKLAQMYLTKTRQSIQHHKNSTNDLELDNRLLPSPSLGIVLIGQNEASLSYVNQKIKICRENGILYQLHQLPQSTSKSTIIDSITTLNNDSSINGILVQLPLPEHIDRYEVIQSIDSSKDVDCLNMRNIQKIAKNEEQYEMLPCTPAGIMNILEFYDVNLRGMKTTIVGRGNLVGFPLAYMLLKSNAQLTICHKYTPNLQKNVEQADLLIACAGNRHLIKGQWIKQGAVVIDAGCNKATSLDNSRMVGDVEFSEAVKRASLITPVPGGVGPMTVAMLVKNIYTAWSQQYNLQTNIQEDYEGHYVADYLIG